MGCGNWDYYARILISKMRFIKNILFVLFLFNFSNLVADEYTDGKVKGYQDLKFGTLVSEINSAVKNCEVTEDLFTPQMAMFDPFLAEFFVVINAQKFYSGQSCYSMNGAMRGFYFGFDENDKLTSITSDNIMTIDFNSQNDVQMYTDLIDVLDKKYGIYFPSNVDESADNLWRQQFNSRELGMYVNAFADAQVMLMIGYSSELRKHIVSIGYFSKKSGAPKLYNEAMTYYMEQSQGKGF